MINFKISMNPSDGEVHKCVGRKEGDLYIYECPICDYKIVFDEGKDRPNTMKRTGGDPHILHKGAYTSPLASGINNN